MRSHRALPVRANRRPGARGGRRSRTPANMTNQELSAAYFSQAKSIIKEMEQHHKAQEWNLVVRRAQEAVELMLKGLMRRAGLEIPRLHDVGNILAREKERLPKKIQSEIPRIISVSRRLSRERETSFYGDEAQELPPSELYTQIDADQARQDVEWLLSVLPT